VATAAGDCLSRSTALSGQPGSRGHVAPHVPHLGTTGATPLHDANVTRRRDL